MRASVIIPTKDRPTLLLQSLRSAAAQTWPDIEILVVDDNLRSGSVDEVCQTVPGVKVVRPTSSDGPSAARKFGVSVSSGDYVLFLDDDDLIHPNHIRSLLNAYDNVTPNTIVSGPWRRFEVSDSRLCFGPITCCPEQIDAVETLAQILDPFGEGIIWTSSVLWPRTVLNRVTWDEALFGHEDLDFFGRVVLAGFQFTGRSVGMAYYRSHQGMRIGGAMSKRGLVSSTQYRLKWSELLRHHPVRHRFERPMQSALMSLILDWSRYEPGSEWLLPLREAFLFWGGRKYFIPNPPQKSIKRWVATVTLVAGGPSALGALHNLANNFRSAESRPRPGWVESEDDARVIGSFK